MVNVMSSMSLVSNIYLFDYSFSPLKLCPTEGTEQIWSLCMYLEFIANHNLADFSKELVWHKLYNHTQNKIIPNFWSGFELIKRFIKNPNKLNLPSGHFHYLMLSGEADCKHVRSVGGEKTILFNCTCSEISGRLCTGLGALRLPGHFSCDSLGWQ